MWEKEKYGNQWYSIFQKHNTSSEENNNSNNNDHNHNNNRISPLTMN